ncbi:MAG: alpha amylase C-terminal domain-containing protein, partial [Clostridia bacterium]|nr:alpha amylase C-terminal domain-containing protein [Clostridia bacterium]
DKLTFLMTYAFSESYILPFSHDEVVYGKRSLIGRMQGNYEARFAQLRLLYAYRTAFPGKKLEFMGSEFAQFSEWDFKRSLEWFLLDYPEHRAYQSFVREMNFFYRSHAALHHDDDAWEGYRWLALDDAEHSIIAFRRRDPRTGEGLVCVFNFTPGEHGGYEIDLSPIEDEIAGRDGLTCAFSTNGRAGRAEIIEGKLRVPLYGYEAGFYTI